MTLSKLLLNFIDGSDNHNFFCLNDEFAVINSPSFAVLPNHPYRNPLVVALYCKQGVGKGRVSARTFDICSGSFFIVLPGQITELIELSDDFKAVYIIMTEQFTNSLGIGNTFNIKNIIAQTPLVNLEDRARQALEGYLAMCRNLISVEKNPHRAEILQLITRAFFLGLGYFLHQTEDNTKTRQDEITTEFLSLVEKHYKEHRDLEFYASCLGLTPKHISKVVKQSSGKSATEWIEKYVTLDAITQLTSTSRTIKEIAFDLNFPSQSFFGKYFSRIMGTSPAAYRAMKRE